MSVIVKGMEMPDRCSNCPLRHMDFMGDNRCVVLGLPVLGKAKTRPSDCPLLPLPSEHGDLIDRDALLTQAWQNFYKHEDDMEKKDKDYLPLGRIYEQNGFEVCQQTIVNTPTVVPAERSES